MLTKLQIDEIIHQDLKQILSNNRIYKFASFKIGLEKILLDKTLNFSHPEFFNDPFDCNEKLLKISLTEKEITELFNEYKSKVPKSHWDILWKDMNDPKMIEKFNGLQRDQVKISCFSANYSEVLMWSHYAEKHSGICIGFDFPHEYMGKFILAPVKYVSKLRALDGNSSLKKIMLYWLTTKSKRWKYEEEIRAIANTNNSEKTELIEFDSECIKEVIFGCNVNENSIDEVIQKIKNSNLDIKRISIKKMCIDTNTFLLKEELIKPSI